MVTQLITLIMLLEGFSPVPYPDANGFSIGYGHFIQEGEDYTKINKLKSMELLKQDLQPCLAILEPLNLPDNQVTAIGSLCYNIGVTATKNSTLLRYIKANIDLDVVADEFDRWIYSQGEVLSALVKRRNKEKEIFLEQCLALLNTT